MDLRVIAMTSESFFASTEISFLPMRPVEPITKEAPDIFTLSPRNFYHLTYP